MTMYYTITPAHGGFGEFVAAAAEDCDEHDALVGAGEQGDFFELGDGSELPAGVEDIRGRIHYEPARVFALVSKHGVSYFGLDA